MELIGDRLSLTVGKTGLKAGKHQGWLDHRLEQWRCRHQLFLGQVPFLGRGSHQWRCLRLNLHCPCRHLASDWNPRWETNRSQSWLVIACLLIAIAGAAAATPLQSCPTLWDAIDGSPSGSPVSGILQARTPEWVAISFSNAWKWKVKVQSLSCVWLLATPWTVAHQAPPSTQSFNELRF